MDPLRQSAIDLPVVINIQWYIITSLCPILISGAHHYDCSEYYCCYEGQCYFASLERHRGRVDETFPTDYLVSSGEGPNSEQVVRTFDRRVNCTDFKYPEDSSDYEEYAAEQEAQGQKKWFSKAAVILYMERDNASTGTNQYHLNGTLFYSFITRLLILLDGRMMLAICREAIWECYMLSLVL